VQLELGNALAVPWRSVVDGIVVTVRLTPKGGRDTIEGIESLADRGSALKVRVLAAAMEGSANAALIALMAKATGVPKRDVSLVAGETARLKRLKIAGAPAALCATLAQICSPGNASR
jgi:uncharacterized protein (TIGR00251 family)